MLSILFSLRKLPNLKEMLYMPYTVFYVLKVGLSLLIKNLVFCFQRKAASIEIKYYKISFFLCKHGP
jgi:hypothetical protein